MTATRWQLFFGPIILLGALVRRVYRRPAARHRNNRYRPCNRYLSPLERAVRRLAHPRGHRSC